MTPELTISYDDESQLDWALQLAKNLHLPIDKHAANQLQIHEGCLQLKIHPFSPMKADFTLATWGKRREEGKKQGIIRACKPCPGLNIIDATGGWGRDAALMAVFGARVLILERNPVMAMLLEDALERRSIDDKQRLALNFCQTDAISYLHNLHEKDCPDIIYLDPMHPKRQKAALVKKDLQILQNLVGADDDAKSLLEIARKKAVQKVVVKWPQHAESLDKPSSTISGKTVRYDIFSVI